MFEQTPGVEWSGRDDSKVEVGDTWRLFQIVKSDIGIDSAVSGSVGIIGFQSDEGVRRNKGRPGAVDGPIVLREALANLPAYDMQELYDFGNVKVETELEEGQELLGEKVASLLEKGVFPVVLGGGHEVAFGTFLGLNHFLEQTDPRRERNLVILNLDAHFDVRASRPASSGTPFDQIFQAIQRPYQYACWGVSKLSNTPSLYKHAVDDIKTLVIEDTEMQERHTDAVLSRLQLLLAGADDVYLTIDLDVLPAPAAPGVSAPAAYGVPLSVIEAIVTYAAASGKVRVFDVAEMNPLYDEDGRTARAAARLVWRLMQGVSLPPQPTGAPPPINFKGKLQEIFQRKGVEVPIYKVLTTEGPDHKKVFQIGCFFQDNLIGTGTDVTKKEAEQGAAEAAYTDLTESGQI